MKKIAVGDLGEFWYGDYKEPFEQLEGAVPGYPVGVLLKSDEGQLLCPYCPEGKTYDNLGAHAAKIHGMPSNEFKDEVGLLRGSALVSEKTRQLNSAQAFRMRAVGKFQNLTVSKKRRSEISRLGGELGGRGKNRPEAKNKTGRCYAQVLATGRSVMREYGRVTQSRMQKHGIGASTVAAYFGSWEGFLAAMGDSSKHRSGFLWRDTDLLRVLHSVAEDLGHTPTVSDMRRYGMPTRRTYEQHFGTWNDACRRAGVQVYVPGQWARREPSDQEDLAVLSGYAISGTMAKAAKHAGISWQRATRILARFGILPLWDKHPDRPAQMVEAARIARNLAGLHEPETELAA